MSFLKPIERVLESDALALTLLLSSVKSAAAPRCEDGEEARLDKNNASAGGAGVGVDCLRSSFISSRLKLSLGRLSGDDTS